MMRKWKDMMVNSFSKRIAAALAVVVSLALPAVLPGQETNQADALVWIDAAELTIRGRGWDDVATPYDRYPERARELVRPPVWTLSLDSAGLYVEFSAETAELWVRWELRDQGISMPHMPATGVSGLDLYVWDVAEERWRWLANSRPGDISGERRLFHGIPPAERRYRLYLPLYNGIASLAIGAQEAVADAPAEERKPVVFYGTSITQGASAMRPGMAYPAILGRRLGYEAINLGFSGNGRLEPEVATLLAELDPEVYVLDPLPNVSGPGVTGLLTEFIQTLRAKHPETPIVLVESIIYTNGYMIASRKQRYSDSNAQMRAVWEKLSAEDERLFLVEADDLLGEDGEDTVDGTHPTDLGFYRIANGIEPVLRKALQAAK